MRRLKLRVRPNWEARVEEFGFNFHHMYGDIYWDESAAYAFSMREIDELEEATDELHGMALKTLGYIIDKNLLSDFAIPPQFHAAVKESWKRGEFSLYGRFDFRYDGKGPPKLYEYNADTPTGLFESSIVQWLWLQDVDKSKDQFNSLHEKLIERWRFFGSTGQRLVHFTSVENVEDYGTAVYIMDTAVQAGLETRFLYIEEVGWDGARFVDTDNILIDSLFKLYPWEWMVHEDFGKNIVSSQTRFIEPMWKMILSNKMLLVYLWKLFPDSPYLLRTGLDASAAGPYYVRKPLFGREGTNMLVRGPAQQYTTGSSYEADDRLSKEAGHYVYQEFAALPDFEGNHPVIGCWVVGDEAAGMGIREDRELVTQNMSRFIPHWIE